MFWGVKDILPKFPQNFARKTLMRQTFTLQFFVVIGYTSILTN